MMKKFLPLLVAASFCVVGHAAARQSTVWAEAGAPKARSAAAQRIILTISAPPDRRRAPRSASRARNTGCRNSRPYRRAERVRPTRAVGTPTSAADSFELFDGSVGIWQAMKMRELYSLQENVLDRCEDAAKTIEEILIENS